MKCMICSSLFQDYLENTLSQDIIDEMNNNFQLCEKCKICFKTYSLTIRLSQKIEQPCCASPESVDKLRQLLIERFFSQR
jgi:hypothetical protein